MASKKKPSGNKGLTTKELRKKLSDQLLKGELDLITEEDEDNLLTIETDYYKWKDGKYYISPEEIEEPDHLNDDDEGDDDEGDDDSDYLDDEDDEDDDDLDEEDEDDDGEEDY